MDEEIYQAFVKNVLPLIHKKWHLEKDQDEVARRKLPRPDRADYVQTQIQTIIVADSRLK